MEGFRYKRNGHLIDGVFIWVDDYGYYYIGDTLARAEKQFRNLLGKNFHNGDFIWNDTLPEGTTNFVPFPINAKTPEYPNPMKYFSYFFEGARLKSFRDWQSIVSLANINHKFPIEALSNATSHPVCAVKKRSVPVSQQGIFYEGVLASGTWCPVGSEKIYTLEKGNCICIEMVDTNEEVKPFSNLDKVVHELEANESEIIKKEAKNKRHISLSEVEEKVLKNEASAKVKKQIASLKDSLDGEEKELVKLLDELFLDPMKMAQDARSRLNSFNGTEKGKEALEIFQEFLDAASHLVSMEITDN